MKLLDALGPNPRAVRMFLHEKQLDLPCEQIDILGAANRRPPFSEFNPGGQLPALLLDDGSCIAETVAICEYLEDLHPAPPLIGSTPREKAETRMWQRRVELNITENLYNAFRYSVGLEIFRDRMHCLPEAAPGLASIVQEKLAWMISEITKGQLLILHLGKLKDAGKIKAHHISLGKRNNVWVARECARMAREILGANGIVDDYPVIRHMMNIESVFTYEGTHDIHGLIIGEAVTGIPSYNPPIVVEKKAKVPVGAAR